MVTENLDVLDQYSIERTGKTVPEVYKRLTRRILSGHDEIHFRTVPLLLQIALTEKQALLADACPGTPEDLAAKVDRSVETVQSELNTLYQMGVVVPSSRTGVYNIWPNVTLFIDRFAPHTYKMWPILGPEYVSLWNQWDNDMVARRRKDQIARGAHLISRVLPAIKVVKDDPDLQPWEDVRALVRMRRTLAIVPCHCRLTHVMERTCGSWSPELCLVLDRSAEYNIDSGNGRQVTADEAIAFLANCEDAGLYHGVGNTRVVDGLICTCCSDCCQTSTAMRVYGNKNPTLLYPSRYTAVINRGRCDGCEGLEAPLCAKTCPFGASVVMRLDKKGVVNKAKLTEGTCMGCGVCAIKCPREAITLKCVKDEDWVPADAGRFLRPGQKDTDELWARKG